VVSWRGRPPDKMLQDGLFWKAQMAVLRTRFFTEDAQCKRANKIK
jgi:hypothetical protein